LSLRLPGFPFSALTASGNGMRPRVMTSPHAEKRCRKSFPEFRGIPRLARPPVRKRKRPKICPPRRAHVAFRRFAAVVEVPRRLALSANAHSLDDLDDAGLPTRFNESCIFLVFWTLRTAWTAALF
jgi:hypothetical protein